LVQTCTEKPGSGATASDHWLFGHQVLGAEVDEPMDYQSLRPVFP
jgi:hypothetical protein